MIICRIWDRSGLLAPIKSIGVAGSCAGFRRLLAYKVPETYVGEVQAAGSPFALFFWMQPYIDLVRSERRPRGDSAIVHPLNLFIVFYRVN